MRAINSIAGSSSQPPSILDHHTALAAKRVPVNYAYSTTSSITTAPTTYNDPSIVSKSVRRSTPSLAGSVAHSSFISTTANPTRGKVKPELHEGHAFQSFSLEDPVAFSLVESPQQAVSPSPSLPDLADGHTTRSNHSMAAPTIEERRKSSRSSILNTLTRTSKSIPILRGSQTVSPTSAGKEKSPTASENALASPAKGDAGEVQKVAASPKTLIAWKGDSNGKPEESLVCRICFDLLKQNGEMTALKCQCKQAHILAIYGISQC
ncbi:hypothetical protein BC830DRAFT_858838 [Chytriomyces sp. MP71]|nr:hypothetical protein BC830DRAFT_858838 [Chytriomyces sp. MP71]